MADPFWIYEVEAVDGIAVGKVEVGGHLVDSAPEGELGEWRHYNIMRGSDPEAGQISTRCIGRYEGPLGPDGRPCSPPKDEVA